MIFFHLRKQGVQKHEIKRKMIFFLSVRSKIELRFFGKSMEEQILFYVNKLRIILVYQKEQ